MKICFVHPTDIEEDNDSITNYIRGIIKSSYAKKHDIIYIGITKNDEKRYDSSIGDKFFIWGKFIKKTLLLPVTLIYLFFLYKFIIKNKNLFRGRIVSINQIEWALPFLYPVKSNPVVITIHGFHGASEFLKKRENTTFNGKFKIFTYNFIEKLVIKKVDKVIVVSQERYDHYVSKYPNEYNKIIFIPPFIDNKKFFYKKNKQFLKTKYGLSKNDTVLLYIGRIVKGKNIDLIVKSFKKLNEMKKGKKLKLLLVGNGTFKENIEDIIKNEKIKNIFLISEIFHSLIPEIINCANIFLLISSFEGTPISVLEALSCGIPVIASRVGDLPKIINNINGCLLSEISESELINAINYIKKINIEPYKCAESIKRYWASNVIPMILTEYSKIFYGIKKVNN